MVTDYNKLVRDKIPQRITYSGKSPTYCILDDDEEYLRALDRKLDEEVCEYYESHNVEELADIVEVIYALAISLGYSVDEFENAVISKRESHGSFLKRVYLESVESDSET